MTATIAQTVGIDISKLTLNVHLHPQATARQFPNTTAGINALLTWLGSTAVHSVVFEPTGAYLLGLERQLGQAGLPMTKVNPLQARRFAEAIGQRAKTDAVTLSGRRCRHARPLRRTRHPAEPAHRQPEAR